VKLRCCEVFWSREGALVESHMKGLKAQLHTPRSPPLEAPGCSFCGQARRGCDGIRDGREGWWDGGMVWEGYMYGIE